MTRNVTGELTLIYINEPMGKLLPVHVVLHSHNFEKPINDKDDLLYLAKDV